MTSLTCVDRHHGNRLNPIRLFGVGLDASDDPNNLQLKLASMNARQNGQENMDTDPYDALYSQIVSQNDGITNGGKLPIPSWLTPRPAVEDKKLISAEKMAAFIADGGARDISQQIKDYVKTNVLPGMPLMIGVDHSATGGVLEALSEHIGPKELGVVIMDQHFDGLPVSLRLDPQHLAPYGNPFGTVNPMVPKTSDDAYCCGNFLTHLMDEGVILPENLMFLGVADYPPDDVTPQWERFRENYHQFEKRGCRFFPLQRFTGSYSEALNQFIATNLTTSHVYVSLDLDVGAYRCVHAARYMDREGLDETALNAIANALEQRMASGDVCLAGMDVMEFNMHFLGITVEPGKKDATASVALNFINQLLSGSEMQPNGKQTY
jgi:arginase family enzyme